jgi:parvulin-like peptidyl-prolyl isomerase
MSKKQKARKQAELEHKKSIHRRSHARIAEYETRIKMLGIVLAVGLIVVAVAIITWVGYRNNVLAYVGRDTITRAQVTQVFEQQASSLKQQGMDIQPGSQEYQMLWDSSLEASIQEKLALNEANRLGIVATPTQIQAEITKTASYYSMTEDQLKTALAGQNTSWDTYVQGVSTQLQRQAIYDQVTGTETVTEDEINTDFQQQQASYDAPANAGVNFIFLDNVATQNGGRSEEQTKTRGEEAIAKLKSGTSFGDAATQYSDDQASRDKKGNLGTITPSSQVGKFGEAFDQAVFTSTVPLGGISDLVPIKNGFGIFQIYSLTPSYTARLGDRWNFTFRQITCDTATAAQAALDEVKTGTTFAQVAANTSTDTVTGPNGGDMGTINRKSVQEWQLKVLDDLSVDQVSEVISDGNQYYILKLNQVQTLKEFITSTILDRKKNDVWTRFIEDLKGKNRIVTLQ